MHHDTILKAVGPQESTAKQDSQHIGPTSCNGLDEARSCDSNSKPELRFAQAMVPELCKAHIDCHVFSLIVQAKDIAWSQLVKVHDEAPRRLAAVGVILQGRFVSRCQHRASPYAFV